jgi:hypothetical protein
VMRCPFRKPRLADVLSALPVALRFSNENGAHHEIAFTSRMVPHLESAPSMGRVPSNSLCDVACPLERHCKAIETKPAHRVTA